MRILASRGSVVASLDVVLEANLSRACVLEAGLSRARAAGPSARGSGLAGNLEAELSRARAAVRSNLDASSGLS